jgi:hypothetical protein
MSNLRYFNYDSFNQLQCHDLFGINIPIIDENLEALQEKLKEKFNEFLTKNELVEKFVPFCKYFYCFLTMAMIEKH